MYLKKELFLFKFIPPQGREGEDEFNYFLEQRVLTYHRNSSIDIERRN